MAKLDNEQLAQVLNIVADSLERSRLLPKELWETTLRRDAAALDPPPKLEPVFGKDRTCIVSRETGNVYIDDTEQNFLTCPKSCRRALYTVAPDGTITVKPIGE